MIPLYRLRDVLPTCTVTENLLTSLLPGLLQLELVLVSLRQLRASVPPPEPRPPPLRRRLFQANGRLLLILLLLAMLPAEEHHLAPQGSGQGWGQG